MAASVTKPPPTYLKSARMEAGFPSRDTAAAIVPFSPETIGRHERGEVAITPDDALVYAKCYDRDDIAIRYCADCPIGQATGRKATERDLPFTTLRLTQRLRKAAKEIADTLEAIADDGIVDESERPAFDMSLASLHELSESITDIVLYAASHGIKKEPPLPKGQPQQPA